MREGHSANVNKEAPQHELNEYMDIMDVSTKDGEQAFQIRNKEFDCSYNCTVCKVNSND